MSRMVIGKGMGNPLSSGWTG